MARISIEDCLRHIENRFALVAVASDRTRRLINGEDALVKSKNKDAVTALREIAEGLIVANDSSRTTPMPVVKEPVNDAE